MYDKLKNKNLFNMDETMAADIFWGTEFPWEVLGKIKDFIIKLGATLSEEDYDKVGDNVWIAKTATVAPTASINGPCIIGKGTEVRQCAFIRGNAIVGENCVVGNSTELKNVILFNNVQVPHYNYEGDIIETGLKKMGAILGNYVEVGCNSVLNPGTIIGSNTNVYPLSMVRGYIPSGSIYKHQGEIARKN